MGAGGIADAVDTVPKDYSTSFLWAPGGAETGVTGVVLNWGTTLQYAHSTERRAAYDVVTTKLGYWTDNQAYYDWYHWFPNVSRAGKPQDVLLALKDELTEKNLTVHYWQLDAYWYKL